MGAPAPLGFVATGEAREAVGRLAGSKVFSLPSPVVANPLHKHTSRWAGTR